MIDYEAACKIVERHLNYLGVPVRIVDDQTKEYDWGWVIYWNFKDPTQVSPKEAASARFPFLVERVTGASTRVGTAGPKLALMGLLDLRDQKLAEMRQGPTPEEGVP